MEEAAAGADGLSVTFWPDPVRPVPQEPLDALPWSGRQIQTDLDAGGLLHSPVEAASY
jgi:hypothetical protein